MPPKLTEMPVRVHGCRCDGIDVLSCAGDTPAGSASICGLDYDRRTMRITRLTFCVLMPAAIASAQVAATAPLISSTVLAGASAAPLIVPGTNVWGGIARSVTGAASGASLGLTHQMDLVQIDLQWQLHCQAISNSISAAEAEVRFEMASPFLQSGNLIIDWLPTVTGTGQASLAIDIGDDGSVDAQGSTTVAVTFQPQSPLIFRVTASTNALAGTFQGPWGSSWSWSGSADAQLGIRFVPTHAQTTIIAAQPCSPAPTLQILPDLSHGVDLQASAAPADQLALFVLGFQPTAALVPLSAACSLFVDPVVVVAQPLQPGSSAHQQVLVPHAVRPVSFLAQLVTFDPVSPALTASSLLRTDVQ